MTIMLHYIMSTTRLATSEADSISCTNTINIMLTKTYAVLGEYKINTVTL